MNEKFIKLFEKSNMTKAEFCRVIGLKKQNANVYFNNKSEMKISTFEKFKNNYTKSLRN